MKKEEIRELLLAKAKSARAIMDAADVAGREMTGEERGQVAAFTTEVKSLKTQYQLMEADEDMRGKLRDLDGPAVNTKGGGRAGSTWAAKSAEQILATAKGIGYKALISGSIDVPTLLEPTITLPDVPTTVLDLVPRPETLTGNTFEYVVQTVRTNNAAVVADGATKPTSVYTFASVSDRVRVIAHLSEAMPERLLADHSSLETVLDSEMRADLLAALEEEYLSGDGTGEHFTGLLHISGTTSVPFSSDILTTMRKARTALSDQYVKPTAWVLNPADLETIDLLQDNNGRPFEDATLARWLGPYPRVSSQGIPAGTAVLADWTKSSIYPRQDVTLDADRSGTLFTKNEVMLRCEARFGIAFNKPDSFALVDLTA